MENLMTFDEFVNEQKVNEAKYGTNHLKDQGVAIGNIIKKESELKVGDEYCIVDLGLAEWNGGWVLKSTDKGVYKFESNLAPDDNETIEYTKAELKDAIKGKEFAECVS